MDLWNRVIDGGHAVLVQEEYLTKYRIHGTSVMVSKFAFAETRTQWVRACILARHQNRPEPTLEQFQQHRSELSWPRRFAARRRDYGRALYKSAVFQFSRRSYARFVPTLAAAMALEPWYVLKRLLPQLHRA